MLEWLIALAVLALLIRYVWVSMQREPKEDFDADPIEALDSIRAALPPIEVRASDFAALDAATEEVSRRPRVPAHTSPLPTIRRIK
jgi:hypothetical protein